jgi:Divergent InlB B-repeat domain/IPTL-CTERM motif
VKRNIIGIVLILLYALCIDVSTGGAAVQYQVTAQVSGGNGSLDIATPSPATVDSGLSTMFIFDAATGYHVADITDTCGSSPYNNTSNSIYLYPFITAPITLDCAVTATFAINDYSVSASAGSGGSLSGSTPSPAGVDYGSKTSFTFNAGTGYHIGGISGCGSAYSNSSQSLTTYSFTTGTITADCTVTATFAINHYSVSASAGTNGSLSGSTPSPATVNYGSTTSFTFNADGGYHVAGVSDTCGSAPYSNSSNAVSSYTFTTANIPGDCTVSATFAINHYSVSASAGSGGSLSSSTPSPAGVDYGSKTSFTFNADTGYHIAGISGCGIAYSNSAQSVTAHSVTTGTVTADCTVTATFAINRYTVSFQDDGKGSVSGATSQTVNYGSDTTAVTANPDAGYHFVDWTVTGGGSTTSANPLKVTNVVSDMIITANFSGNIYSISGTVGIPGVTLTYDDGGPRSVASDGSGNYSLTVPYNWTGTITPTKPGYTFVPASRSYNMVRSDQATQGFTATSVQSTVAVPTLSEWGMLLFALLAGLGALYHMKRREKKSLRS